MSGNFATATELEQIVTMMRMLDDLVDRVNEVSIGDAEVFDTNGESLGLLRYEDGNHRFYPKYNW